MPPDRKQIAVIDDDASVRKALDRQIRAAGYRTQSFASAEEFLLADTSAAACVICDIHLGGMSGLELVLHPTIVSRRVPVVLISSSADPAIEVTARGLAATFLCKPIPAGKLLEAIVDTAGPPIGDVED
jgi:FixJ family two-component response regulator